MIDIKLLREKPDHLKAALARKKVDPNLVDTLLEIDEDRRRLTADLEERQAKLNALSKEVGRQYGQKKLELIHEASALSEGVSSLKPEKERLDTEYDKLLKSLPNFPDDEVPSGEDESDNRIIRQVGQIPTLNFTPKEHHELGEALGVIDVERAANLAGSRFVYLKGKLALLEFALLQFAFSIVTNEERLADIAQRADLVVPNTPFIPVIPPVFIRPDVMDKMARLEPRDERYFIQSDDLMLVGSAEHTLGPLHMDELLAEADLPIRYAGFSTAFRREAGSYGKDMKGMFRLHQFDKLELESFTTPEMSRVEQDFIVAIQEHLMQSLGIPYQVVANCTGDMGAPDARQFDIETWMPGQQKYRETHSADLMTDYQSRRLNTRLRREDGTTDYVHMNDATAFAIGRTIIAIMENYQQSDGSIRIPDVLVPYLGFTEITKSR